MGQVPGGLACETTKCVEGLVFQRAYRVVD